MADTVFVDGITTVVAEWLNDVNSNIYKSTPGTIRGDFSNTTNPALGDALVGVKLNATGSVARTQDLKNSDTVYLSDFGGVADWNGTTGTDNRAAILAMINYLSSTGGVGIIPKGAYYVTGPIIQKRGVNIKGEGQSHPSFFDIGEKQGTTLFIDSPAGQNLWQFESTVHGHYGLENITIRQTGVNIINAALSIRGVLSPFVKDVTLLSTNGIGLEIGSNGTDLTLYGVFENMHIRGVDAVSIFDAANSNTFIGGSWAGTRKTLKVGGPNLCRGLTFSGVGIEGSYSAGVSVVDYTPTPTTIYGWLPNSPCYSVSYVDLDYADGACFSGGYTELGGVPANYDDGTHGSLPLIGVVNVRSTSRGTGFYSLRWASFLLDKGLATFANNLALTNTIHTTQVKPYLFAFQTAVQVVPKNTNTKVVFGSTLNTDLIALNNSVATILSKGIYNIRADVDCGTVPFQEDLLYLEISVNGTANYRGENHYIAGATGGQVNLSVERTIALSPGDTVQINIFHNSGTATDITLPADYQKTSFVITQI